MKFALIQKLRHGAIWQAMRERGWTQRQLAKHLGIHETACGEMLRFKYIPKKPDVQMKLMELTGVAIDDLFPPEAYKALTLLPTTQEQYRDIAPRLIQQSYQRHLLPSPEQQMIDAEPKARLHAVLKTLSPKEQKILELRYGFDGEPRTYDEVGQVFGVSRERIRQLELQALKKLKKPSAKHAITGTPGLPDTPLNVPAELFEPKPEPKPAPKPKAKPAPAPVIKRVLPPAPTPEPERVYPVNVDATQESIHFPVPIPPTGLHLSAFVHIFFRLNTEASGVFIVARGEHCFAMFPTRQEAFVSRAWQRDPATWTVYFAIRTAKSVDLVPMIPPQPQSQEDKQQ